MKATSQRTFHFTGGEREGEYVSSSMLVLLGCLGVFILARVFLRVLFSGMQFTGRVTEILFGIRCPFHVLSSNQTCLIREPAYSVFGMQL